MWVIWLGPAVTLAFLVGMAGAAVLVRLGRVRSPLTVAGALALPFGCAVLPLFALALASVAVPAFASGETALYHELLGEEPPREGGLVLLDDSGTGPRRLILARIDAPAPERARLLRTAGLSPSTMPAARFEDEGLRRGLRAWWMAAYAPGTPRPLLGRPCLAPRILAADGFQGWARFRIAACAPSPDGAGTVFIAAHGR